MPFLLPRMLFPWLVPSAPTERPSLTIFAKTRFPPLFFCQHPWVVFPAFISICNCVLGFLLCWGLSAPLNCKV